MQTQEPRLTEKIPEAKRQKNADMKNVFVLAFQNLTPIRLKLLLFLNIVLAGLFCISAVLTVNEHIRAIKTVGLDTAPSITSAYEIKSGILAMDADIAARLIASSDQSVRGDLEHDFEKSRIYVCERILNSARNISMQDEILPVERLQIYTGKFCMLAQQALDLQASGNSASAIKTYLRAANLVDQKLLAETNTLEKLNLQVLESSYAQERSAVNLSRGFSLVLGLLLAISLTYTHIYISAKFRRRLCPPILFAMLCLIFYLHHSTNVLAENGRLLKVTKADSFNSMLAIMKARVAAYELESGASRFLLTGEKEEQNEGKTRLMHSFDRIFKLEQEGKLQHLIDLAETQLKKSDKLSLPAFTGCLADEYANLTFAGESRMFVDTLSDFAVYKQAVDKMLTLATSGATAEAAKMCLTYSPTGSKYYFNKFEDSLMRLFKLNHDNMEKSVKEALAMVRHLGPAADLLSMLVIFCVYIALAPRMNEYSRCIPENNSPGKPSSSSRTELSAGSTEAESSRLIGQANSDSKAEAVQKPEPEQKAEPASKAKPEAEAESKSS